MDESETGTLAGNRWVLTGAVLYLLEWVAILTTKMGVPVGAGTSAGKILHAYAGHTEAFAWAAGWFSVVLLGRVLIVTGLRTALVDSGRPHPLMDLAVVAMAASVVVEVATYAVTAGAAWTLDHGGSDATVRGLDAAAFMLNQMVYGPLGVAVLCSAWAMWRSTLFPRALCVVGLLAGGGGTLLGLAFSAPGMSGAAGPLSAAVPLFWIWMLWTGVVLWRRVPAVVRTDTPAVAL